MVPVARLRINRNGKAGAVRNLLLLQPTIPNGNIDFLAARKFAGICGKEVRIIGQDYEAEVETGDAHERYAGSAANLQLLWTASLSQQVVGRSNKSNSLRC